MTTQNVDWIRAVHQAAHVVVATHFDMRVTYCGAKDFRFRHQAAKSLDDPSLGKYLAVMLAGPISSVLFFQYDDADHHDRSRCIAMLLQLGAEDGRIQEEMLAARSRAVTMMKQWRPVIERVAAALLARGELDQEDIDRALRGAAADSEGVSSADPQAALQPAFGAAAG